MRLLPILLQTQNMDKPVQQCGCREPVKTDKNAHAKGHSHNLFRFLL